MGIGIVATLAIALLAGTIVGFAPRADAGGAPVLAGDPSSGWIPDIAVTTDLNTDRRPALTTDANGDILIAYESNAAGNYDVLFSRSTNAGQTWSSPVAVTISATDEVFPSITTDPFSGRIFLTYQLGISGGTQMMAAYSDDGITWTRVTAFSCGVTCERPKVVSEYWNGASNRQYIVFAGPISAGTDWNWAIVRSLDQGASWVYQYESGLGAVDVRQQPSIAVQQGTDGTDRVIVFYRSGASSPGASGSMQWSTNYAASWSAPSIWVSSVASALDLAASHDGDSVLAAYSTGANDVVWAVDTDPTDLTCCAGIVTGQFTGNGANVAVTVDGTGSTSLTIGGSYHMIARDLSGHIAYTTAPVGLVAPSAWTALATVSDSASSVSGTFSEKAATTRLQGGTWYPGVAWTDLRDPDYNVYYTTPGNTYVITTDPPGLQVTIDGFPLTAPVVTGWASGEIHTIGTASPQPGGFGTRYVYQSWSDGGAQSHTITVGPGSLTITARFSTEFSLTISSPHPGASGGGWYPAFGIATIAVSTPQPGGTGTRYVFAAWTGDMLSALNPAMIAMDGPKTVIANWRTEYELTVVSAHGNVTGEGWYRSGDPATITVAEREVTEGGRTWQFTGWSGDATGAGATVNVSMSGPMTVTAIWREKPGLLSGVGGSLLLVAILAVALLLILLLALKRRKPKSGPSFQQMQPMAGQAAPPPMAPPAPPAEAPTSPWPPQPPSGPAP